MHEKKIFILYYYLYFIIFVTVNIVVIPMLQEHFGTVYETSFCAFLSKALDVKDNEICKRSNSIFCILCY